MNSDPSLPEDPPLNAIDAYVRIYQRSLACGLVPLYCSIPQKSLDDLAGIQFHQKRLHKALELLGEAITMRLAPSFNAKVIEKWPGIYIIEIEDFEMDVSHKVEIWLDDLSDDVLRDEFHFHTSIPARYAAENYHGVIHNAA